MGRRKKSIGIYPMNERLRRFVVRDRPAIEEILGCRFHEEFFEDLEGEMTGWLLRFEGFREVRYGTAERKRIEVAQGAATRLGLEMRELGAIGDVVLERFSYPHGVSNEAFLAVLRDLDGAAAYLDDLAGEEINVAGFQVHALEGLLQDYDVDVTVTHGTGAAELRPSAFVRFVDQVWTEDDRLRLYPGKAAGYWEGLSQWLSARLREDVDFNKLKLERRSKLK